MRLFFALICMVACTSAFAQDKKINNTAQLWSETDFIGKINSRWKWQVDLQYSSQSPYEEINLFKFNSQATLRPWLHYFITKDIRLSAFAGEWYNFAITEVGAREYPEYRTALQLSIYNRGTLSTIHDRFRIEFRDMQDRHGAFEMVLRGRYMFKYQRLIKHTTYDKNSMYCIAFNEFFVNGGSAVTGVHLFDQNRLFAGIGYNFTDDITVETGYFNQLQQHAHDNNFDMNHIWQLSLIVDNIRFKHNKVKGTS